MCATGMLSLPTRLFLVRAAVALAAMYGFCVLAPSLALAFFDDPAVPFCLTGSYSNPQHRSDATHVVRAAAADHHADHAASPAHSAHHDHSGSGAGANPADCCGLFPMVGMFGEVRIAFRPSSVVPAPFPALTDALEGRGPERINKPPIG